MHTPNTYLTLKQSIMKTILLSTIMLLLTSNLSFAQVAINNDGNVAGSSAMLDVSSTTKGLLIPRMTTVQRNAIISPINGLLVFDTNTKSFWFYDDSTSSWKEILSNTNNSSINDYDDDTKVIVDDGSDNDIIRFYNEGTEFFSIDSGHMSIINTGQSVFIGRNAGKLDDMSCNRNVAIGESALEQNKKGETNTAIGFGALYNDTSGSQNTAVGKGALVSLLNADDNTAIGYNAMFGNKSGTRNVAIGTQALYFEDNQNDNTAIGYNTLYFNNGGNKNVAVGNNAMESSNGGDENSAFGYMALNLSRSANRNTALGAYSAFVCDSGVDNVVVGHKAMYLNTNGSKNIVIGSNADYNNVSGNSNTIIGYQAGRGSSTHEKSGNIFLGHQAGYFETGNNKLYIDNTSTLSPLIYGEFDNNLVRINGKLTIYNQYAFPETDGAADEVLTTDGNGVLSWEATSDSGARNINDLADGITTIRSLFLGDSCGASDNGSYNRNTALGYKASAKNVSGDQNVALGYKALYKNSNSYNTSLGAYSMTDNTTGNYNVAIGNNTFNKNTSGSGNTIIGAHAGTSLNTGSNNTIIGHQAGSTTNHAESGCVFIGNSAGTDESHNNRLHISNSRYPLIYGEFDNKLVKINGKLGVGLAPNDDTQLRVDHDGLYSGYFTSDSASTNTKVVWAEYTSSSNYDAVAVYGRSTPDNNGNYGIGGKFLGNYYGVYASTSAGLSTGSAYGVYSKCMGNTHGSRYGVYGEAYGNSEYQYGVYGKSAAVGNSFGIYCNGNGVYTGTWSQSSDRKLKKNIEPLQNSLSKLLALNPVTYEYRTGEFSFMNLTQGSQIGFIAQELEEIFPELVTTAGQPKSNNKNPEVEVYKAINYIGLIPALTGAIKEQQQTIKTLQETVNQQTKTNNLLLNKLKQLEARLNNLESKQDKVSTDPY
jgi:uncharacterized coiled-coil protein SlyX